MMLTALKIALIIAVSGLVVFTADYTRLTKGAAWKDPIGLTIMAESVFLIGALTPFLLAVFFRFSTLGSQIGSWVIITFFALGGLVMYWRTIIFETTSRKGKKAKP